MIFRFLLFRAFVCHQLRHLLLYEEYRAKTNLVSLSEVEADAPGSPIVSDETQSLMQSLISIHPYLLSNCDKYPALNSDPIRSLLPYYKPDCTSIRRLSAKAVDSTVQQFSKFISDSLSIPENRAFPIHDLFRKISVSFHAATGLEFISQTLHACGVSSEISQAGNLIFPLLETASTRVHSVCLKSVISDILRHLRTSETGDSILPPVRCVSQPLRDFRLPENSVALEPWVRRVGNRVDFVYSSISDHVFPPSDPGPTGLCGGSSVDASSWMPRGGPRQRLPDVVSELVCKQISDPVPGCLRDPRDGGRSNRPTELGTYSPDGISVFPCPSGRGEISVQHLRGGLRSLEDCDAVAVCPGRGVFYDERTRSCQTVRPGFVAEECGNRVLRCPNIAGPLGLAASVGFNLGTCTWKFVSAFEFSDSLPESFSFSLLLEAAAGDRGVWRKKFPIVGGLDREGAVVWKVDVVPQTDGTVDLELSGLNFRIIIGNLVFENDMLTFILAKDEAFLYFSDSRVLKSLPLDFQLPTISRFFIGPYRSGEGNPEFPPAGISVHLVGVAEGGLNFRPGEVGSSAVSNFRSFQSPFLLEGSEVIYAPTFPTFRNVWSVEYRAIAKFPSSPVYAPPARPRPVQQPVSLVPNLPAVELVDESPGPGRALIWEASVVGKRDRAEILESASHAFALMTPVGVMTAVVMAAVLQAVRMFKKSRTRKFHRQNRPAERAIEPPIPVAVSAPPAVLMPPPAVLGTGSGMDF